MSLSTPSKKWSWWTCQTDRSTTPSIRCAFSPLFATPTSSDTSKPSTMRPPSHYGTICTIQHRHGVRRRRRFAPEDIRLQEERTPVQGGRNLGYFSSDRQRIDSTSRSQDPPSRYKSTKKCIQSANVFLTKNGVAKLGDMNVSKVVRKDAMCETQTGTPYYASP